MPIENQIKDEGSQNASSEIEIRDFSPEISELRIDDTEGKKLRGYAAKFGNFYDLGWFKERVQKGAFDDVLGDDVRCLKNHDPNLILGRTASGTLNLMSNNLGLLFVNDMPDTSTGKDTLEEIRRGDISGCSFSFTVSEDDWKYFDDERPSERTIVKIGRLFDVGPVVYPANPKTSVVARDTGIAKRSLESFQKEHCAEDAMAEEKIDVIKETNAKEDPPAKIEEKPETEKLSQMTIEEKKEAEEKVEKEKRERRQGIEKGYREAACINKRVTDQINAINNKSAKV